VHPRSGLSKRRIDVALGTIDSDYTGPIGVIITNNSIEDFVVKVGDRIAQLVITECCTPELIAVDALTETARGGGGFGSTGVSS